MAWSPDGSSIAAASRYGQDLSVWDRSGKMVSRFTIFGGGPYVSNSLAFVDGASRLIFHPPEKTDNDISFVVWDVASGRSVESVTGPAPGANYPFNRAQHFAVSPDQKLAVVVPYTGKAVAIYETKSWQRIRVVDFPFQASSLCFFPDSRRIVLGAAVGGRWAVLDAASGETSGPFVAYERPEAIVGIGAVAVSPTGDLVLTGIGMVNLVGDAYRSPEVIAWSNSIGPADIWRISDGSRVTSSPGAQAPIWQAVWDPKGRFIAFVDQKNRLFVARPSGAPITRIELQTAFSLAVAQDGDRLAVTNGNELVIYEVF